MKKHGMAIPIVLIFATILGLISTFLLKSAKNYNKQNITSYAQLQSYFIARAGVEHAMIKIKYLHRELYDAICLSQGRNPLFDFTSIEESSNLKTAIKTYNPGPIFLYKQSIAATNQLINPNFNESEKDRWLKTFCFDLTSEPREIDGKSINKTLSLTYENLDSNIQKLMTEPFKMASYEISQLNIAASDKQIKTDNKIENNAIIEFTIKSSILTAKDNSFDYQIKKTVKISRD